MKLAVRKKIASRHVLNVPLFPDEFVSSLSYGRIPAKSVKLLFIVLHGRRRMKIDARSRLEYRFHSRARKFQHQINVLVRVQLLRQRMDSLHRLSA
jgi:hypothetical protein